MDNCYFQAEYGETLTTFVIK